MIWYRYFAAMSLLLAALLALAGVIDVALAHGLDRPLSPRWVVTLAYVPFTAIVLWTFRGGP